MQKNMSQGNLGLAQNQNSVKTLQQSYNPGSTTTLNFQCPYCNGTNQTPLFLQCGHTICWSCADTRKQTSINNFSNEQMQQIDCRQCNGITHFSNITELYRLGSPSKDNKIQESQAFNSSPPERQQEQNIQYNNDGHYQEFPATQEQQQGSDEHLNYSLNGQTLLNYSLHQSPLKRSSKLNKFPTSESANTTQLKKSSSKLVVQQQPHMSENYESENPIFQTLKPQIQEANICSEHREEISLYCTTDKQICCVQCVYQSQIHKKHNVIPIKQAIQTLRDDNQIFIHQCRDKMSHIEEAMKNCQYNKSKLTQLVASYKALIQSEFEKLIQLIQSREEEALSHIKNFHDSSFKDYESKQENLQFLKNCIKEYYELDKTQESIQQETTVYLFSIQNMLKNTLKNFSIKTPILKCENLEIVEMNTRHHIQTELQNLGKSKVKSFLASAMTQMQSSSAKKPQQSTNISNITNASAKVNSRSRSPIPQQQKEQQTQNAPKTLKKSPNSKSHLHNIKGSAKEYQWKEMATKMSKLAEGISSAQRSISPLNSESHQKDRMIKRLQTSKSTLNFQSNRQNGTATTPKQKQISALNEQTGHNNNIPKSINSGLSTTPNSKKPLEIKTNISPNQRDISARRSVTPNSLSKQQQVQAQGLSNNLGYTAGTFKSQVTPKRSSGYNPFLKDKSKVSSNYQSRGSQKGDENYQSTNSNTFGQNPIGDIKEKVESNHFTTQSRNRSESPMYINVNEFQNKPVTYKSQHAQKALNSNNSNANLKNIPVQSSVGGNQDTNNMNALLIQQNKSQSYSNLHQNRNSVDLKQHQQLQQIPSQNSTPTLKAEKALTPPTSSNQLSSSLTGGFAQPNSNNQIIGSSLGMMQQQQQQQQMLLLQQPEIEEVEAVKKLQHNQYLDSTSHFQQQNEDVGSFQEKERALLTANPQGNTIQQLQQPQQQQQLQSSLHMSNNSNQLSTNQSSNKLINFQNPEVLQLTNSQQLQQQQNIIQQQQLIQQQQQNQILLQQQQLIIQQMKNQSQLSQSQSVQSQQPQQFQQLNNLQSKQLQSNCEGVNDTLFQRSSMFNFQQETENFSPFKQQPQLSPIANQQLNSQYSELQPTLQSPPHPAHYLNQQPAPFVANNQSYPEIIQDQFNQQKVANNSYMTTSFSNNSQPNVTQQQQQQSSFQNPDQIMRSQQLDNLQRSNAANSIQNNSHVAEIQSQPQQIRNSLALDQINRSQYADSQQQNVINRSLVNSSALAKAPSFEQPADARQLPQPMQQSMGQQHNIQDSLIQQQIIQQQQIQIQQLQQLQSSQQMQQQQMQQQQQQQPTINSSSDNNFLNSQFSFTPNKSNQYSSQNQNQQEQNTVYNTITQMNHDNQYSISQQQFTQKSDFDITQTQQNNQSYATIENSFNMPTPKHINFQNEDIIPITNSSPYKDTSSNTTTGNFNGTQQSYKTATQQSFTATMPHNHPILIQQQDQFQQIQQLNQIPQNQNNSYEQQMNQQVQQQQQPIAQLTQPSTIFGDSHIFNNILQNNPACTKTLPVNIKKTKLLYRLSDDGANSQIFHRKCDGQGPTITFIKCNGEHIFGYFLPIAFCRSDQYSTTDKCFIFTLQNSQNVPPTRFEIRPEKKFISIYQNSKNPCLGSTLNGKQDLIINFDNLEKSCSNVGYAYKIDSSIAGDKILAGQYSDWNISEIEIYALTI